jgi:hypothetical protein
MKLPLHSNYIKQLMFNITKFECYLLLAPTVNNIIDQGFQTDAIFPLTFACEQRTRKLGPNLNVKEQDLGVRIPTLRHTLHQQEIYRSCARSIR